MITYCFNVWVSFWRNEETRVIRTYKSSYGDGVIKVVVPYNPKNTYTIKNTNNCQSPPMYLK